LISFFSLSTVSSSAANFNRSNVSIDCSHLIRTRRVLSRPNFSNAMLSPRSPSARGPLRASAGGGAVVARRFLCDFHRCWFSCQFATATPFHPREAPDLRWRGGGPGGPPTPVEGATPAAWGSLPRSRSKRISRREVEAGAVLRVVGTPSRGCASPAARLRPVRRTSRFPLPSPSVVGTD